MEEFMRDLTPDLIKSLSNDQMELLVELGEMAKMEADLTEQIETIRKLEEKVGMGQRQNRAIYEDSEYDELLSAKAVREREAIRDKIKNLINNLVKNGLGDLSLIHRQAANYGIDVKNIK